MCRSGRSRTRRTTATDWSDDGRSKVEIARASVLRIGVGAKVLTFPRGIGQEASAFGIARSFLLHRQSSFPSNGASRRALEESLPCTPLAPADEALPRIPPSGPRPATAGGRELGLAARPPNLTPTHKSQARCGNSCSGATCGPGESTPILTGASWSLDCLKHETCILTFAADATRSSGGSQSRVGPGGVLLLRVLRWRRDGEGWIGTGLGMLVFQ